MRPLRVVRFKQDPRECAIAASASVANFCNKDVTYLLARDVVHKEVLKDTSGGLYAGHIGLLLNHLGFRRVTVITSDLDVVDFTWNKLSHRSKVAAMSAMLRTRLNEDVRDNLRSLRNFAADERFKNSVVVDYKFGEHIRTALDAGIPIIISYNWTLLWRFPKQGEDKQPDDIKGTYDYHAVCLRGYNDKGVHVVDSHWEYYKRKLKQYRNGYYLLPWEDLLSTMGKGELVIPSDYDENLLKYELV